MTARPWIVHLSEETRALVHGVLTDAVEAVGNSKAEWWTHGRGAASLLVARAARLRIGRRGALFTIYRDGCRMAIPARGAPAREQMLLSGMLVGDRGGGATPNAILLQTLASWRDGLAVPVDAVARDEAHRFRQAVSLLGRGLAARLDRPWTNMQILLGDGGRHSVELGRSAADRYESLQFLSWAQRARDGLMSPALIKELDRLRGTRIHASERHARHGDSMPDVHIGPPPALRFVNDGDVLATMRGIAALPVGAELVVEH